MASMEHQTASEQETSGTATATANRPPRKGKRPRKKRRVPIWGKVLLGFVCAVVVLAGLAALYVNGKLDLIQYSDGTVDSVGSIDADEDQDLDATGLEENTDEMVMPQGSPFQDSNVLNILLISTDERTDAVNDWDAFTHLDELDGTEDTTMFSDDARADSLILVSLNIQEDTIKLVSIERATGVPILLDGYEGEYDWITHTFRYGGAKLTMDTVETCFNVAVDHYVRINFNSFVQIVDAVGGVDINLTEEEAAALNWEVPSNSMLIGVEVTPGVNHMDGYTALQYARLRAIDNDWNRIQRQRTVIQAVLDQIKDATPMELDNLLNKLLPVVQTNFTRSEITALLVQLPGFLGVTADQMSLPAEGTYGVRTGMDDRQMYDPDWTENVAILHEFLYGADAASDVYPEGENLDTDLDQYSDEELSEMGDYLTANMLPVDLTTGEGLWPQPEDLPSAQPEPTAAPDSDTSEETDPPQTTAAPQEDTADTGDETADASDAEPCVWLTGEDKNADSLAARQAIVYQLADQGMRYLLSEEGFASSLLLDEYINGGDESLLDTYAEEENVDSVDLAWYRWLRAYNENVSAGDKLHLIGLGVDANPALAARGLSTLRDPSAEVAQSVEDVVRWLDTNDNRLTDTGSHYALLRLRDLLNSDYDAVAALFGDNMPLVEQFFDQYDLAQSQWQEDAESLTASDTAEAMYQNFVCRSENLPENARFYGALSLENASLTAIIGKGEDDYTTFAAYLSRSSSPVNGNVSNAALLSVTPDGPEGSCLPNNRTFDYTLLQSICPDAFTQDSWLVLDGEDSPFLQDSLFMPGEEEVPAAADYFSSLLTLVTQ